MSGPLDPTTAAGLLDIFGLFLAIIGGVLILVLRGKSIKATGGVTLVGLALILIGMLAYTLTPAATTTTPPATVQTVNVLEKTTPALFTGESWNSVTGVLTVDLVFNYTSNYFYVCNGNLSAGPSRTACAAHNYILLPLSLVRTDASNTTAAFPMNVASIPTAQSLGSNPQTYSFVGYKPATNSQPGQWQVYWGSGTTANQYSTVNAPSVATNIAPDSLPVTAFSSSSNVLHVSLAGGNSTSAPATFYQALTVYSTYTGSVTVGNGTPATIQLAFVLLGESS